MGPASNTERRTAGELVLLIGAALLLGGLMYSVSAILTPFVLLGAVTYLLYPMRNDPVPRRLLWLAAGFFAVWFFMALLPVLAPFLIALLLTYLLNPAVSRLERKGVARWMSSLLVVLILVGLVTGALLFVLPPVIGQFDRLLSGAESAARRLVELVNSGALFDLLARYGVPVGTARELIARDIAPRLEAVLSTLIGGVFGLVTGLSGAIFQVINAVIIPFLLFYLLKDTPAIAARVLRFFPPHRREAAAARGRKVDALLGRYLRGAILVALIQGTISSLVLWFIGVDYALVLGIMTAVLNFVPYLGLLTSLIVASLVALFSGEPVVIKVVGVVILYLGQKLLEATVLAPKIIGGQVGLHPALLILSLLVFGTFLGFIGLLVAVPVTALLVAGYREWEERTRPADTP